MKSWFVWAMKLLGRTKAQFLHPKVGFQQDSKMNLKFPKLLPFIKHEEKVYLRRRKISHGGHANKLESTQNLAPILRCTSIHSTTRAVVVAFPFRRIMDVESWWRTKDFVVCIIDKERYVDDSVIEVEWRTKSESDRIAKRWDRVFSPPFLPLFFSLI